MHYIIISWSYVEYFLFIDYYEVWAFLLWWDRQTERNFKQTMLWEIITWERFHVENMNWAVSALWCCTHNQMANTKNYRITVKHTCLLKVLSELHMPNSRRKCLFTIALTNLGTILSGGRGNLLHRYPDGNIETSVIVWRDLNASRGFVGLFRQTDREL